MMNKKSIPFFVTFIFYFYTTIFACTTAIISGNYTIDGRPVLWKHRDTSISENKLMYFDDGKYSYIGLVNSVDSLGTDVWAGANSAGFSIMNSASYNLKDEETELADQEGIIMKMALQQCATLQDFEDLLLKTSGKRGIEANFGVIDASGGAAYYEANDTSFTKFDANDPKIAPFGYIIRTNYSFSRKINDGYGYIRYQTAENLFYQAAAENDLSVSFILKKAERNLTHSLTKVDLRNPPYPISRDNPQFVCFQDYINRYTSVSSMIIRGVKPGEPTALTTIWTILGFPLCSVAIPTWVAAGAEIPAILSAPGKLNAPLCEKALRLKELCFPVTRGSGKKYLNLAVLLNQEGKGILQILPAIEEPIITKTEAVLAAWEKRGFSKTDAKSLYLWFDKFVADEYKKYFGL